jgi:hypothetical protein
VNLSRPSRAARAVATLAAPMLLAVLACASSLPSPAGAADAALTVNLEAGGHKAVRLRNLPKDAVMAVGVQSTGSIAISLLGEADYRTFPKAAEPVFAGSVERTLSFQIVIPAAGNYYLVLDNRRGGEACKVKLGIRAQRGRAAPPADSPRPELDPGTRKQGA